MRFSTPALLFTVLGLSHPTALFAQRSLQDDAGLAAAAECNKKHGPLKFALLENEAVNAAVEDDISASLEKIGFTVNAVPLSKEDINTARQAGDFHFSLTETWGAPYDPNSYAAGWVDGLGGEGVFPAMVNFTSGSSRTELLNLVQDVLKEEDPTVLQTKWNEIHNYYHSQAVMLPIWGKRIPTLMNTRLTGYEKGFQQFDYPIHRLQAVSGSTTIKIAPGARTGLFKTVGGLDAHTYGPNEFFSSNWIYEGLVAYGEGGQILPSLAASWNVVENDIGGDTYIFTLRENVKFHDGEDWNCAVAKLNFDHLLAGALVKRHGWYGIPLYTEDWICNDNDQFVIRTNTKHGPYLQELTFIRPIRMISPKAFMSGNTTDPLTQNSCHMDWGTIDHEDFVEDVECAGIASISGTGPYTYVDRDTIEIPQDDGTTDSVDNLVIFEAHENYWGGAPGIKRVEVVRYETAEDVKAALLSEELDVVWGSGVLSDTDIFEIDNDPTLQDKIRVFHSGALQNVILLLNTGKPPFDDINVRKTVIHAINKAAIVDSEFKGLQTVVDNVFPRDAAYCDVDLTPRWDYDLEKAILLSCESGESEDKKLAFKVGLGLGIPCLLILGLACVFFQRSQKLETELDVLKNKEAVQA